jgi:C1A family cysteine protease
MKKHLLRADEPDVRDYKISSDPFVLISEPLPSSVDLSKWCSPIKNQGELASCSAIVLVDAVEYLEIRAGNSFIPLSQLFVYYNERVLEHTTAQDSGARLRDGVLTLATYGVCSEQLWPYVPDLLMLKPSDEAYADAATRKIKAYARVDTTDIEQVKRVIASGYPILFGIEVYPELESTEAALSGSVSLPKQDEESSGGHAVLIVGYNDLEKTVLIRNSWGTNWGKYGYFTLPYEYVTNPDFVLDAWIIC